MTDVNIGKLIHDRRIELGMTMKELGEKCDVSEATISRYESGNIKNMRRDVVAALAKALQINPKVLMDWHDEPSYYTDPETAKLAEEIKNNPGGRVLFDAGKGLKPESVKEVLKFIDYQKAKEGQQ